MEILRIEDLTFAYPSCEKNAVDGVSLAHSTNDTSSSFVTFRLSSNVRQVRLSVRISFSISFPFLKVRGSTGVFDKAAKILFTL